MVSAHIPYEVPKPHSDVTATSPAMRTAPQIASSIMRIVAGALAHHAALDKIRILQMMHAGWEAERALWEDTTRAARSVLDVGNALTHLEDWIALDYAPRSDVRLRLASDACTVRGMQCKSLMI